MWDPKLLPSPVLTGGQSAASIAFHCVINVLSMQAGAAPPLQLRPRALRRPRQELFPPDTRNFRLRIHGNVCPARTGPPEGPNFSSEDRDLRHLAISLVTIAIVRQNCKSQGSEPESSPFSSRMRAGQTFPLRPASVVATTPHRLPERAMQHTDRRCTRVPVQKGTNESAVLLYPRIGIASGVLTIELVCDSSPVAAASLRSLRSTPSGQG